MTINLNLWIEFLNTAGVFFFKLIIAAIAKFQFYKNSNQTIRETDHTLRVPVRRVFFNC